MTAGRRRFGALRKLPSGRLQASYLGPDGLRHAAPQTFATKRDADRWLSLVESEIMRGVWSVAQHQRLLFGIWAERWFASYEVQLKRTTSATYRLLLDRSILPTWRDVPLNDIRPIAVGEWMRSLGNAGNSPSWVRKAYRLMSQILKAAVDNDMLAVSPCRGHRMPRLPDAAPTIIEPDDMRRLASCCPEPHDLVVLILGFAGLRIGEALALRRCDVLDGGHIVRVAQRKTEIAGRHDIDTPKSHQVREVAVPADVQGRLVRHLSSMTDTAPEALLFPGRGGKTRSYNGWRGVYFDRAVEAAGLGDVTPHDLRASHASWVAEHFGVMAAARRLGHANASVTTRHYARALDRHDEDIARAMAPVPAPTDVARQSHEADGTPSDQRI